MDIRGLTDKEVIELTKKGLYNYKTDVKTKTIRQIIMTNFLTLFNFLNLGLGLAVFLVGSYKNLLFLGVVICNTFISTFQEIRSKKIVDKLSLLNEPVALVIRNGEEKYIDIHTIVLGDVIKLSSGNQIPTDSKVIKGEILVNESLITGESDGIEKKENDELLSGSFVISGKCYAKVMHVAEDNYTSKISKEAKYIKKVNSEIMNFIKKIIKYISIIIIPIGLLLFLHQLTISDTLEETVVNTVAALVGMIPEGLVLLTSTVLAVSVVRLSKYNVLVQELYCIETLARVDTICLDKTGTITKGQMEVLNVVPLDYDKDEIEKALGFLGYYMDDNQTISAISKKYSNKHSKSPIKIVPFNSQNKWSSISFDKVSYILGAPEIVLKNKKISQLDNYIENRVVLLAKSSKQINKTLPDDIEPMALVIINDKIRSEATSTLNYFKDQGVDIKLISGDNPKTVAAIAKKVGLQNIEYIDMSNTQKQIKDIITKYNVFGRVNPKQKKEIILALKEQGHTVAMTGDGVNDVLALKEADCSIAMNSGSDAARNVSQLVLLDSNFASMPKVVSEGRRSINNLQRSSSLFLCKTTYATLLALIFLFLNESYPFIPIQLTLTSVVTIGIPSFILALEPNNDRINGKIIINVLNKSLPTALTIVFNIIAITIISNIIDLSSTEVSTLAVVLTGLTGFMLLYRISVPFNRIRRILFISLISLFSIGVLIFYDFFSLSQLNLYLLVLIGILFVIATVLFNVFSGICTKIVKKIKFKN